METEKVTHIEDGKDLIVFTNALATFGIKEKAIQALEKATELEIADAASETVVRKFRQTAKSLQVNIEKHRLKLTREFKKTTDIAAGLLEPRVTAVYDKLDVKVKAVEAVRAEKAAVKAKIESERLHKIKNLFSDLNRYIVEGQAYNLGSEAIMICIDSLKCFEISAIDFEEHTEQAEAIKIYGLEAIGRILADRVEFEEGQAEAARVKKEQEVEAKRLADEKAKFEAGKKAAQEEQIRKNRIQTAIIVLKKEAEISIHATAAQLSNKILFLQRYFVDKDIFQERFTEAEKIVTDAITATEPYLNAALYAEQKAEKTRKANADLKKRQDALDKAEAALKAKKQVAEDRKFAADWNEAHLINFNMIHELAIEYNQEIDEVLEEQRLEDILKCHAKALGMNTEFDLEIAEDEKLRKEKLQADKERPALVGPDKMLITTIATDLDKIISEYEIPVLNTAEGNLLVVDLIAVVKAEIHAFETAGGGLV